MDPAYAGRPRPAPTRAARRRSTGVEMERALAGFRTRVWTPVLALLLLLGSALPARAIEFWDERIQIHGFFESRMAFGYEDFNQSNEIDMYGWTPGPRHRGRSRDRARRLGPLRHGLRVRARRGEVRLRVDPRLRNAPERRCVRRQARSNLPNRVQTGERLGFAGRSVRRRHAPVLVRRPPAPGRRPLRGHEGRPARREVHRLRLDQRRLVRRERGPRRHPRRHLRRAEREAAGRARSPTPPA